MVKLRIPGQADSNLASSELAGKRADGLFSVTPKAAFRIDGGRAFSGEMLALQEAEVDENDLVEIELEGGVRLWTTVDQLRQDLAPQRQRGAVAAADELLLPVALPFGTPSRGLGTWILKALRISKVDLAEDLADKSAVALARRLEDQLKPGPGLYSCSFADRCDLKELPAQEAAFSSEKPALLFIHGTASSTDGSFGGLWERDQLPVLRELHQFYEGRLYAYQHRTLTESPIENALALAKQLPAGARLHIVTHSRGGLIGELLCRSLLADGREPFDAAELKLFQGAERAKDRQNLEELATVLKAKGFKIERFLRVACPARGTTLASGRLDRYLSIIVNALGLIPVLRLNPVYELATGFLLTVLKTRTKPDELPGLEAMMPDSPLVRLLNRPGIASEADLAVIAGDIEGEGLWGRLKVLATDLFYREDHDLVVNTSAMYGGMERVKGARYFFDQGPEVCHFSYFRNEESVRRLKTALLEDSAEGFLPLPAPREITQRTYRGTATQPLPVVFLLPGIMGSHLAVDEERVWLDPVDLACGAFARLQIDAERVVAEAPMASVYLDLIDYLQGSHEVIPFPFDWRRSILVEARRLADAVSRALDQAEPAGQPVRLLGHSMGGLVARAMIAERPDLWERICQHPGGRLIMLGTPNGGSFTIPRLLLGQEAILRQLSLLDFKHDQKELLKIIAAYPGVLEMLPFHSEHNFFDKQIWRELAEADSEGWVAPIEKALKNAKACREVLDSSPIDSGRMLYVAGRAPATPVGLEIEEQQKGRKEVRFLATSRGDGRVPWSSGIPNGVRTWYLDVSHGQLANHRPAFSALQDLLEEGFTTRLRETPPLAERGSTETFQLPAEELEHFPSRDDLVAAALGAPPPALKPQLKSTVVRASVAHGNLAFIENPVAVGHYQGDTIASAEAFLDNRLNGLLRQHHHLGLYAGALETAEVFFNPTEYAQPGGAIVIGLGKVGELTAGALTRTFAHAALKYATAIAETSLTRFASAEAGPRKATLTTLLIGTGAGGMSVADSVSAILRGVKQANLSLAEARLENQVIIDAVEFLELWEDRAIQAAHVLERVSLDSELGSYFDCRCQLRTLPGKKARVTFDEPSGWYHRLQILGERNGALRFCALTGAARSEVALIKTQRGLVDRFVESSMRSPTADNELAKTLFELLMPNRLKEQAPNRQDLVLVLNEDSASYPWELMQDRWGDDKCPPAVAAGLLRQLETQVFRERVQSVAKNSALVIGDPQSSAVPLPGAQEEAQLVAGLIEGQGFHVESRLRANADQIVSALHADAYRVLHLAGHGVYRHHAGSQPESCHECGTVHHCEGEPISGMLIGDGAFLTPADVEQMRQVPELVFINCCHLGRIEAPQTPTELPFHRLAANLAAQFIRMGVRAVVAAGWAVDDAAAKTFASCFYREMLRGAPFGDAVLVARKEAYRQHPGINTWGAYQCYGDPDFTLSRPAGRRGGHSAEPVPRVFVAPSEAVTELENLTSEAMTASDAWVEVLRKQIRAIRDSLPQAWRRLATVQAALGKAFGEIDLFEDAIHHYRLALDVSDECLPVAAIEQLANLRARWSVELHCQQAEAQPTGLKCPRPAELIAEAKGDLNCLLQLNQTVERHCLLGGTYKREAMISSDRQKRIQTLAEMSDAYRQAHEKAHLERGEVYPYPVLNWLIADLLLSWLRKGHSREKDFQRWLDRAQAAAERLDRESPSFWNSIIQAETLLLRHLDSGELGQQRNEILDGYLHGKRRGASPREFRSVREHLAFLLEMLSTKGIPDSQTQLYLELEKLNTDLLAALG